MLLALAKIKSITGQNPNLAVLKPEQKPPALTADALKLDHGVEESQTDEVKTVTQPVQTVQPIQTVQFGSYVIYTVGHKNVSLYCGLYLPCFLTILTPLSPMETGVNTLQYTYLVFLTRLVTS